jgi:hypothetical protein
MELIKENFIGRENSEKVIPGSVSDTNNSTANLSIIQFKLTENRKRYNKP